MEAKNINTIEDADRFVEGCLNDLIEGISTKSEIMIQMARYTGRIAELALQKAERTEVVSLLKEYANDTGAVDTNLKARVKMYLAEHKL